MVFLHRLEERRLRLRRRPVDLVGQDDLREDRPLHEAQAAMPAVLVEHLRAGDIGRHQVRGELDPLEGEVEDLRERLDQQRLGQSGHAGDQAVSAGEERHQHLVDDRVLADDDFADLVQDAVAPEGNALGDRWRFSLRRRVASMCQRIDDFVDFHPVRLRRELHIARILGGIRPFPAVAHVRVPVDQHHRTAGIVLNRPQVAM